MNTSNRDEIKARVKEIWSSILKNENIGYDDNYFLLGGDSIKAIKIVNEMQKLLKDEKKVPIQYIFSFPTISKFVEKLYSDKGFKEEQLYTLTSTDLEKEATFSGPMFEGKVPVKEPQSCLLTGATGYLGSYLIRELIKQTKLTIYCLVRGADLVKAQVRLQKNIESLGLSDGEKSRVIVVCGDLSKPKLGMAADDYEALTETIDTIYHNAALVHFLHTYEGLKKVNLEGTKGVLNFAAKNKLKPVFYVSTISIFSKFGKKEEVILEDDNLKDSGILPIGYTQSKWVGERVVWQAKERGLPVMVFRLGHLVGDTSTGECNGDDFVFRMIKAILSIGAYPDMAGRIEPIAVDDVAKSIVGLSLDNQNIGGAYHIMNPKPVYFDRLLDYADKKGIVLKPLKRKEWVKEIERLGPSSEFYLFLKYFDEAFWQDAKVLEFSMKKTNGALKRSNIEITPITEEVMDKYYQYLMAEGKIDMSAYVSGII